MRDSSLGVVALFPDDGRENGLVEKDEERLMVAGVTFADFERTFDESARDGVAAAVDAKRCGATFGLDI